jgi:two-component system phosphate regulon sensor histidine kinase PhoR
VVQRALDSIERQLKLAEPEATRVHVTREIADDLPDLFVDEEALVEALLNVLQNAVRYTGPDKEIRVRCVKREKDLVISIADNGPGIPKHEHRRIFEKFYRAVDPANPNIEGTGLGLAIVHHIIRAHQGRIEVESDVGKGATFHICLPAAEV